ncbi:hypothetical protein CR513_13976, partial [Mucuna pruriens]
MIDRSMIDAASGGALMDKTPIVARQLISNMASNTQQCGIRRASQPRMVNEIGVVDNLRLENQLTELISLVRQLAIGQHQPSIAVRVCGICTFVEHLTSNSPSLEDQMKQLATILAKYECHHPRPQDLANIVSQLHSAGSSNLPSQTIPNPRGNASTLLTRKPESDEELLRMFRNVEINIPLLDAIKQISKYVKFLKELCIHKRKKMKGSMEIGGIVSTLTRNEDFTPGAQALPKKC